MSRVRVYIAGPITHGDLADNVNRATAAFADLADAGLAPFCPHWSVFSAKPASPRMSAPGLYDPSVVVAYGTAAGHPRLAHDDWLAVDLAWVAAADAVLRLPGESKGAGREMAEARRLNIPVFGTVGEIVRWARGRAAATAVPDIHPAGV